MVLDASFAVDWLVNDAYAKLDQMMNEASPSGVLAPVFFWHETASALRGLMFRKAVTPAFRDQGLERLRGLDIALDGAADIKAVINVSERYSLTIYDAAYLELAVRRSSDLATTDAALVRAGRNAGLKVFTL